MGGKRVGDWGTLSLRDARLCAGQKPGGKAEALTPRVNGLVMNVGLGEIAGFESNSGIKAWVWSDVVLGGVILAEVVHRDLSMHDGCTKTGGGFGGKDAVCALESNS